MPAPPGESPPTLQELAARVHELVGSDQAAGWVRAPHEAQYVNEADFYREIRKCERRMRMAAEKLRQFIKQRHQRIDNSAGKTTVEAGRLCAFENERGLVFVSAAMTATIIARFEGTSPVVLEADLPVIWIAEEHMMQVAGSASWDAVIRRLGFSLLSISPYDWTAERVLAAVRQVFPNAEPQAVDPMDETNDAG